MSDPPPIPEPLWDTVPPEAQAAVRALVDDPGAADRRPGGAARQELHQLLQAPLLRSPLGQATAAGPPLGQEAGRAARPSPPPPPPGPARATPPGHRVQAAAMPLVRRRPRRRRPRTDPASGRRGAAGPAGGRRVPAPSPEAAPAAAPRPVRPCRRACPPGPSAPGCGPSSASWPGPIAWASDRSGNWPSTCSACRSPPGMICRLERQGAAELEAPVEELREHVRRPPRPTSTRPRGGRAGTRCGSGRR